MVGNHLAEGGEHFLGEEIRSAVGEGHFLEEGFRSVVGNHLAEGQRFLEEKLLVEEPGRRRK